jgi:cell division protein FtsB
MTGGDVPRNWSIDGAAGDDGRLLNQLNQRLLERALPIAILVLAGVGVPMLVFQPEGLPRMRGLEKELAGVTAENESLRREVTNLRADVKELRDDPAAVERIARDQLGLVRKSEIVVQFPRERTSR